MFYINNTLWHIAFVSENSAKLRRSDGTGTKGVTDWNRKCVYLSDRLHGAMLERVLCHELTHCVCFSWNIFLPIELEERLCEFMALHGKEIIYLLDSILSEIKTRAA